MLFRQSSLKRLKFNAFGYATWKSYANLHKKAVEQEFTWGGFVLSLSIAFLFVFSTSAGLNALYEKTLSRTDNFENMHRQLIERIPDKTLGLISAC